MTKEELIGRKFKTENGKGDLYRFVDYKDYKYIGLIYGDKEDSNVTPFLVNTALSWIDDGTDTAWKLLPEEPKMYKTPKGIEYGVGTNWTISSNIDSYYTIAEVTDDSISYTYSESERKLPIKLGRKFFENQVDTCWKLYNRPIMKDYKQVDPKTIKFDFTNTKIKVNNEDESKWVLEVMEANNTLLQSPENKADYIKDAIELIVYNCGVVYRTTSYSKIADNKEITIQDILNNMKEVIEVADVDIRFKLEESEPSSKFISKKKKIISYETVVDLPGIPKGSKSTPYSGGVYHTSTWFFVDNKRTYTTEELQDTKFFKPIYKQDAVELKFSKYNATLSKEDGLVFSDGNALTITTLNDLLLTISKAEKKGNAGGNAYTIKYDEVKEVQVGCKTFTPDDVKLVKDAIKKLE